MLSTFWELQEPHICVTFVTVPMFVQGYVNSVVLPPPLKSELRVWSPAESNRVCQAWYWGLDHPWLWAGHPVICMRLISISGLFPQTPVVMHLPPVVTTKTVPRQCQVFPGGTDSPQGWKSLASPTLSSFLKSTWRGIIEKRKQSAAMGKEESGCSLLVAHNQNHTKLTCLLQGGATKD